MIFMRQAGYMVQHMVLGQKSGAASCSVMVCIRQ